MTEEYLVIYRQFFAMKSFLPEFIGAIGGAFLLRMPARKSISIQHPKGTVTVREGGKYATVCMPSVSSNCSLRTQVWQVLQEALDIYAAMYREAIATEHGNKEYLLWVLGPHGYQLTCVDTFDIPWSMYAHGVVGSSIPLLGIEPDPYHISFRFYRLSQLTDDLFDAYRNAYLCLECLVSDESPKMENESEITWLKRVLGNSLSAAIPRGIDINASVEEIYKRGRLPLFHAKTGKGFFIPQGEEQERMHTTFELLTCLLAALIRFKFGNCFSGGWAQMSQAVYDAQAQATFQFDEVVYRYKNRQFCTIPSVEVIEKPRRFGHLWAKLEVEKPGNLMWLDRVELRYNGEYRCMLRFAEYIPMAQVSGMKLEFNLLQYNSRAPKPSHAT